MLKKFEVRNFKNFGENLVFDLATKNYEFNKECAFDGIVKKAIVYGYNGVGKSNLGFAIFDIVSHVTDKQKSIESYNNYLYAGSQCEIAIFKYTFSVDGGEVYYEYGKSNSETLIYEKIIVNNHDFASIDRRNSTISTIDAKGAEALRRDIGESQISITQYLKNNAALESNANNRCFISFLNFVDGMLFFRSLNQNNYIGFEQGSNNIAKDIIEKNSVKDFESFLNKAGISCKLVVEGSGGAAYLALDFGHKKINFYDVASQGTKSLGLFYYWYQRLKEENSKVTFLFIDEFDAFYHNRLAVLIVNLLKDIKAQAIITTHNTSVMTNELLRPDCYFLFSEKGIQSLADSTDKELRVAHNIEKMYRARAFDD